MLGLGEVQVPPFIKRGHYQCMDVSVFVKNVLFVPFHFVILPTLEFEIKWNKSLKQFTVEIF